jgi:hypothetical protein
MTENLFEFVFSLIENVSTLKDFFVANPTLEDNLERTFNLAVNDWQVDDRTKEAVRQKMPYHLIQLKELVTHAPKGHNPKENELLNLWKDRILADPGCSTYLSSIQQENLRQIQQQGFQTLQTQLGNQLQGISEKIDQQSNHRIYSCAKYWDNYARVIDGQKQLPLSIILCGREDSVSKVTEICKQASRCNIEARTKREALAFVCAAILSAAPNEAGRAFVVEDSATYYELSNSTQPLIIITNLLENHATAVNNGHTVLCCVSPQSRLQDKIQLKELDRDGFVTSLETAGYDETQARIIARDTSRDISNLWREIDIVTLPYNWEKAQNIRQLIPALLLGGWNEEIDSDCELVAQMAQMPYKDYMCKLQPLITAEESPLVKIGNTWAIPTPYFLMRRFFKDITNEDIESFLQCADWIFEDDDPTAVNKLDEIFVIKNRNQAYSNELRKGIFQSIALLSLLQEEQKNSSESIRYYLQEQLKRFDLQRFLSNRPYLLLIAEAAPLEFLNYLLADRKGDCELFNEIFKIRTEKLPILFRSIPYTELVSCLENLAWDEIYLSAVTDILLYCCKYPHDNDFLNDPFDSLLNIYNLLLPQTHANFSLRMGILQDLSQTYPADVRSLCFNILDKFLHGGIRQTFHFQWRGIEKHFTPLKAKKVWLEDIQQVIKLMLQLSNWNEKEICDYIKLSFHHVMSTSRTVFLSAFFEHKAQMQGNERIYECLQRNINYHTYDESKYALDQEQIKSYKDLLLAIESEDFVVHSYHRLEKILSEHIVDDGDFERKNEMKLDQLDSVIRDVLEEMGIEGVFQLSKLSETKEVTARSLVRVTDQYTRDVYGNFVANTLQIEFVRYYFYYLYHAIGNEAYFSIVDSLLELSKEHIAIVLYAPPLSEKLAKYAESFGEQITLEYWSNVMLYNLHENDIPLIKRYLTCIKKRQDILSLMINSNISSAISSEDKVSILVELVRSGDWDKMQNEAYNIACLLNTIDLPTDKEQKNLIFLIELMMSKSLKDFMQDNTLLLEKEIQSSPEVMMQLMSLTYLSDDKIAHKQGTEPSASYGADEIKISLAGLHFFEEYNLIPGLQSDKSIDYQILNAYIDNLQELAKVYQRVEITPYVIGKIIGKIPEGNDYPSTEMCALIEKLNNDKVDGEINCAIFNKQGATIRSRFSGGEIERKRIEIFKLFRDRALGKSPRMVRILSDLIRSYEQRAEMEDLQAERNKLRS